MFGLSAWFSASPAHACTCVDASTVVAPASESHPVGAPIALGRDARAATFCGGQLDFWKVTVDGEPATLLGDVIWSGVQRVAIAPAPGEGAEVVLSKCDDEFDPAACLDFVEQARFVIAAADGEAPQAVDNLAVEHEHGDFEYDCGSTADLQMRATIQVGEREPGAWIEVTFRRDGDPIAADSFAVGSNEGVEVPIFGDASEHAGRELCVDVTAFDAAGNASDMRTDCTAIPEASGCRIGAREQTAIWLVPIVLLLARRRSDHGSPHSSASITLSSASLPD